MYVVQYNTEGKKLCCFVSLGETCLQHVDIFWSDEQLSSPLSHLCNQYFGTMYIKVYCNVWGKCREKGWHEGSESGAQ